MTVVALALVFDHRITGLAMLLPISNDSI